MQLKRTLIIIDGWTTRIAGGDYHMLKVAEYWSQKGQISYLIPQLGYNYTKKVLKGKAVILDSPFENETSNPLRVVLMYCARVLHLVLSPPALEEYDVVAASSHFLVDVIPALYVRSKNPPCKLIAYYHGLPVRASGLLWGLFRLLNDAISVPLLRKHFDLVFAINQPVKDFLISHGVDAHKIVLTRNGVDPTTVDVGPKEPTLDACFVGRLVKSKGVFDLVEMWKGVLEELPAASLAVVGDGLEKNRLAKL